MQPLFFKICNHYFPNDYIFEPSLFQRLWIKQSAVPTAINPTVLSFKQLYCKCSISNGNIFPSLYMYGHSPSWINSYIVFFLSTENESSIPTRFLLVTSDEGDDDLEEIIIALHKAHTQYQALHARTWTSVHSSSIHWLE